MKRQFYLDDVERDLIRAALALWKYRLDDARESSHGHGHWYAKDFTVRRIKALESRLQEPVEAERVASVSVLPAKKAK
jgi:hypothetical protein